MLLVPLGLTCMLLVKDLVEDAVRMVCLTLTFPRFLSWDLGGHGGRVPCGRKQHVWSYVSAAGEGISATQGGIVWLYTHGQVLKHNMTLFHKVTLNFACTSVFWTRCGCRLLMSLGCCSPRGVGGTGQPWGWKSCVSELPHISVRFERNFREDQLLKLTTVFSLAFHKL